MQDCVEEPAVLVPVTSPGGGLIGIGPRRRADVREKMRDANARPGRAAPDDVDCLAVRQQEVVRRGQRRGEIDDSRCMPAFELADHGRAERLVHGDPERNGVAETVEHDLDVVAEVLDGVAGDPAAGILQGLRKVPVIERRHGLDVPGVQAVDQPPVEVEALLAHRAGAIGDDAGPRDREPVGGQAHLGHEIEVGVDPVIVITGHGARITVGHRTGDLAESVPNRGCSTVFVGSALDLIGGGRCAEEKAWWEAHGQCRLLLHCASRMATAAASSQRRYTLSLVLRLSLK